MQPIEVRISSPKQKVISVVATRDFLWRLTDFRLTRRIPSVVRGEARALLRHYPLPAELRPLLMEAYEVEPDDLSPPRFSEGRWEPNGNHWPTRS